MRDENKIVANKSDSSMAWVYYLLWIWVFYGSRYIDLVDLGKTMPRLIYFI